MSLIERNWKNLFMISLAFYNIDLSLIDDKEVMRSADQRTVGLDEKIKHVDGFQAFRGKVAQLAACGLDDLEHTLLKLIAFCSCGKPNQIYV